MMKRVHTISRHNEARFGHDQTCQWRAGRLVRMARPGGWMSIAIVNALLTLVWGSSSNPAYADFVYNVSGTLSVISGPDSQGLDNAAVSMEIWFPEGNYQAWNSTNPFPIIPYIDGSASLTISDASVAANNGVHMFDRSDLVYFADAGVEQQSVRDTSGGKLDVLLPAGGLFRYDPSALAPGATNAVVGGPVELDDFAPATFHSSARFFIFIAGVGIETEYSYDAAISATQTIPEPLAAIPIFFLTGLTYLPRRIRDRR